ncbi:hypothetical protein HPB47_009219 [Ixodes persulcatus]|uniref:Uncharacterized protein n=1 Tax=Ixodes persulcatus TaxID=34615 RepID=A0AC60P2N3_IXOPE|nr:hypothetical protein HPB47_009219 [Ixodes persulcatus]
MTLLAVESAVAEAVSGFNQDVAKTSKAVTEQLRCSTGSCLTRRSLEKDKQRHSKADKAHTESEKVKEMTKRHKPNMTQYYLLPRTQVFAVGVRDPMNLNVKPSTTPLECINVQLQLGKGPRLFKAINFGRQLNKQTQLSVNLHQPPEHVTLSSLTLASSSALTSLTPT